MFGGYTPAEHDTHQDRKEVEKLENINQHYEDSEQQQDIHLEEDEPVQDMHQEEEEIEMDTDEDAAQEPEGEEEYLGQALAYLREEGLDVGWEEEAAPPPAGCPSARSVEMERKGERGDVANGDGGDGSELMYWPVQLHLVPVMVQHLKGADVLLSADCAAYAIGNFHKQFMRGRVVAIGCPKLDSNQSVYAEKLGALIEDAEINTLTVITMEVPCCRGLLMLAKNAAEAASRRVPVKWIEASVRGEILREEWIH